jgi:hypothetical protein
MTPVDEFANYERQRLITHNQAEQARASIVRELTPHTLTIEQGVAARTGFDLALRTRFEEMHEAICDLPAEALREVLLAVEVLGSRLRFELAGREYGARMKQTEASR